MIPFLNISYPLKIYISTQKGIMLRVHFYVVWFKNHLYSTSKLCYSYALFIKWDKKASLKKPIVLCLSVIKANKYNGYETGDTVICYMKDKLCSVYCLATNDSTPPFLLFRRIYDAGEECFFSSYFDAFFSLSKSS